MVLGVRLRARGMSFKPGDGGKQVPRTGLVRSAISALVLAWDMPVISFVFRVPERFLSADPHLGGAALYRAGRGAALRLRTSASREILPPGQESRRIMALTLG
jgi:hypothetical protein